MHIVNILKNALNNFTSFKRKINEYTCEFNIEDLDVYCVERLVGSRTLISFKHKGKLHEFLIICNLEKHNEFVTRLSSKLKEN